MSPEAQPRESPLYRIRRDERTMNPSVAFEYLGQLPISNEPGVISALQFPPNQARATESSFYNQYEWCLNPFLTFSDACRHLQEQLDHLVNHEPGWQDEEVRTNIYLLACAILDLTDDHLLARKYDLSKIAKIPVVGSLLAATERLQNRAARAGSQSQELSAWRQQWQSELIAALRSFLGASRLNRADRENICTRMGKLLTSEDFKSLHRKRLRVPGAYRSQDLTQFDVLSLGEKFVSAFPERDRPLTVLGLRTAGSYFAPLLHAYLESNNYRDVESLTIRPKHGTTPQEKAILARCAARHGKLVIIDEPIGSGSTLAKAVQIACRSSISRDQIVILIPIHPSARNWKDGPAYHLLSDLAVLTLEPEEWHKWKRLDIGAEDLLRDYLHAGGISVHSVDGASARANEFNERLDAVSEKKGHTRFKRVYEVVLASDSRAQESRYVLAKSVGWGWLSYHAFLAAERLAQFVPGLLGLRSGILYTEWIPQKTLDTTPMDRTHWIDRAACYVAARARTLPLDEDPAPDLIWENRNNGLASLAGNLCRAYGARPAPFLRRGRISYELTREACPRPTLIDGKMRPSEWVHSGMAALKCDFEHHGLGKTEINMTDPAYDLAEAILTWQLSSHEENQFVKRYIQETGDITVIDRLLINKLAAGTRALDAAVANLQDPQVVHRSQEFNRDYIKAWNFLVLHTMRYCASVCVKSDNTEWRDPLVVMDVDGVLDKQAIGFPSTTWAGIHAVSLLHSHKFSVILNTARSIPEVKEYCRHYGFLGGVAEYGGFAWDAASNREVKLVSQESLEQLQMLAGQLRRIPGIFLNDDYLFSIRAYTFEGGATRAVPGLLIQNLISQLKLDRLSFHQTYTDTAVVAKEADKGKGLRALLELAGHSDSSTLAIGDSSADLPMFRAATKSFAPGHVSCRSEAQAIGCYIDAEPIQKGLLNIVRRIVHSEKSRCEFCKAAERPRQGDRNLLLQVLKHADESQMKRLLRAMFDPMVRRSFLAN